MGTMILVEKGKIEASSNFSILSLSFKHGLSISRFSYYQGIRYNIDLDPVLLVDIGVDIANMADLADVDG